MQVEINEQKGTVTMSLVDFLRKFPSEEVESKPISNPVNKPTIISGNSEESITNILIQLGVSRGILGFKYLRDAVRLAICDPKILNSIVGTLYPVIAANHDTTPSRAGRAIRHAIETSWVKADKDLQESIFGFSVDVKKGKATNSEYIGALSDHISLKLGIGGGSNV